MKEKSKKKKNNSEKLKSARALGKYYYLNNFFIHFTIRRPCVVKMEEATLVAQIFEIMLNKSWRAASINLVKS